MHFATMETHTDRMPFMGFRLLVYYVSKTVCIAYPPPNDEPLWVEELGLGLTLAPSPVSVLLTHESWLLIEVGGAVLVLVSTVDKMRQNALDYGLSLRILCWCVFDKTKAFELNWASVSESHLIGAHMWVPHCGWPGSVDQWLHTE